MLYLPDHGGGRAIWAVFDPVWYRARYSDAPDGGNASLLDWHLATGQSLGHSPNPWIAEEWLRRFWPGIQRLIEAGDFASAFEAWCRTAPSLRSPHWLFDAAEYRTRYPGLTEETLGDEGLYGHYLRYGAAERRVGHALFDPSLYPEASSNPFADYLLGHDPDRRTSVLFDPGWYRNRYGTSIEHGNYRSALEHYLCNENPAAFDPSPWFSERYYLDSNPGLAAGIGPDGFRNGFAHFMAHGMAEGRPPHPDLDLLWYARENRVSASGAFHHWLTAGCAAGFPGKPTRLTPAHGMALASLRTDVLWALSGALTVDFTHEGTPPVTVVVAAGGNPAATMGTLIALRAHYAGAIDLILIDRPNPPGRMDIETRLRGATVLRFGTALPPHAARQAGLVCARADAVLFLGDGVEVAPGAVDAALSRLSQPGIGAVGGRLVQPHGALLEAGGIIRRDGRLEAYCHGREPLAAEAGFVRDVDFCSFPFLMARRDVLVGLTPSEIAGTAHDAADLCIRIAKAGLRVVYEPAAVAFLAQEPALPDARAAFAAAHGEYLALRQEVDQVRARSVDRGQVRVLFIEDTIPLRRIGSGFVRSNDILRVMAAAGAAVTVFPMNAGASDPAVLRAELPDTVEALHGEAAAGFPAFAAARRGCFDVVWIARTHNLDIAAEHLQALAAPRIVLDTEAVAAARQAAADPDVDRDAALRHEFRHIGLATDVVAVSGAEAALIGPWHGKPVRVLGHALAAAPGPRSFAARSGILFLGAIHDVAHPNYDGLAWFADEVLPLVERALGWETRLTVAGYTAPGVSLDRFQGHARITLRGAVPDLAALYDAHRVVVAPARFAAGLPYKVHEAASFGVPLVTTSLLSRQVGWPDGDALAAADATDPEGFASRVVALYRDPRAWQQMRDAALARVAAELDPNAFAAGVTAFIQN